MINKTELVERRKKNFLPTASLYHPNDPLLLVKATDCFVYDEKGNEYLDAIGGIVCISAGHNHPKIKSLLKSMLEENHIQHTSTLYLNQYLDKLAVNILKEAPKGIDRAFFSNSGSEANELALMSIRQATGEPIVLSLQHAYHGGTASTLSQCGHYNWKFKSTALAGSVQVPAPYCYRCPWGKVPESCALECAKAVESTIQTATHGKIAGMIVEPIMGVGGFITPPKEYFHEVTAIVHKYGGKYVSDEVQTASGRCGGAFFLSKDLEIDVDVITSAKSLGNGAPVGCALLTSEIADKFKGPLHFNTFAGDPYQAAQANMTIDIIREENLISNAREMGNRFMEGLRSLQRSHPLIGDVRGRGLLLGFELVKNPKTKEHATVEAARLMDLAREKGVLIGKGGLFGNVVRVAPPLTFKANYVDRVLKVIDECLTIIEKERS